jgi:hypothetical protein
MCNIYVRVFFMVTKGGGGAATNSGIDFQQRVASFFVLSMGLDLDVTNILEKMGPIKSVAFETDDSIDDIVLYHESHKTYLQVKRKLSLSDQITSDFYKTIEQFLLEYKKSKNVNDCYVLVTSIDSSKNISTIFRNICESVRLNARGTDANPQSKSEKDTYGKFKNCIDSITKRENLSTFSNNEIELILRRIFVVTLAVEEGGVYESAFLTSIACSLTAEPRLIWSLIVAKALDWSKKRQSIDRAAIKLLLNDFVKDKTEASNEGEEEIISIKFDPEKYDICSGREIIIIDSFFPDTEIAILELYRFDENGTKRIKFHDGNVEMGDGSKHILHGRFSTFTGAERYLTVQDWIQSKEVVISQIDSENNYDSSPIAIAYSDKVRNKILSNQDKSKCIHCGNGISTQGVLVEVDEIDLPFDVGMIHIKCCRPSDRVLGGFNNPGTEEYKELVDFDYNKWFTCLQNSKAIWNTDKANVAIKKVLWNSENMNDINGIYCIKAMLHDGTTRYVHQRGKVQRYSEQRSGVVLQKLNNSLIEAKKENNPWCYSSDGTVYGRYNDIQNNSSVPIDLIECVNFCLVKYTRGISIKFGESNNFYSPLIYFVNKVNDEPVVFEEHLFLLSNPMDIKLYFKNWETIGFIPKEYRIHIIDNDDEFDQMMLSCTKSEVRPLVNPFFDHSKELMKGYILASLTDLDKETQIPTVLLIVDNGDKTFTHLYRDHLKDVTLLLSASCSSDGCNCLGCKVYDTQFMFSPDEVKQYPISQNTVLVEILDDSVWSTSFVSENSVSWEEWEKIMGIH